MRSGLAVLVAEWALVAAVVADAHAAHLSIYDIQANTSDGDASAYNGEIQNVAGGVVTHVWHGFNDRVYLQDPAHPTWGAIVVKDGEGGELADNVQVGDWVSFENIFIEEYRGTTFLQYRRSFAPDVAFTVESTGNPVPGPELLSAAVLAYPADHGSTEPYESMLVSLQGVVVGQKDFGKAGDNYELIQESGLAWGTDYMNVDAGAAYDPRIVSGAELAYLTGLVEQYTRETDGWDYYQLMTRSAADIVPEPATGLLLAAGWLGLHPWRRSSPGGADR